VIPRQLLFYTIAVLTGATPALAQSRDDALRQVVAAHSALEWALLEPSIQTIADPAAFETQRGPDVGLGITVYRVWRKGDHTKVFLVGLASDTILHLGGFFRQDLRRIADRLPEARDSQSIARRAISLATLADPHGAIRTVTLGEEASDRSDVYRSWLTAKPTNWPNNQVLRTSDGWLVTATLLSQNTRSITQLWTPLAYALRFDAHGRLLDWTIRSGEPFRIGI
jgi:hypothetical protein